jgi:hypothetical protein
MQVTCITFMLDAMELFLKKEGVLKLVEWLKQYESLPIKHEAMSSNPSATKK